MSKNPVISEVRLKRLGPDGVDLPSGPPVSAQLVEYTKSTGESAQNYSWRLGIRLLNLVGGLLECDQSGERLRIVD